MRDFIQLKESAALQQLEKIVNRPLSFKEKELSFLNSTRLLEHGTVGMKWGIHI